jgi:hypothetical protein
MLKRVDELPVVLTSFAYRREYFGELDGMLATIRKHHPEWSVVVGRGPVEGYELPTLEVDSPAGKQFWTLPVPLDLDGSENDWLKIVLLKGWWMAEVWRHFGRLTGNTHQRIIWLDADGRLNGPLDIELEEEAEVVASPWWTDAETPRDEPHVCSGLLLFQGVEKGIVETIMHQWSDICLSHIKELPAPPPNRPWPDGDQDILTKVLKNQPVSQTGYVVLKLDYDKYCGVPNYRDGTPKPGALVDQWMMNEKMRLPQDRERNWPPPEAARRRFNQ